MDKGKRIITENKNLQSSVQWSMNTAKNKKELSENVVYDEFKLMGSCGVSDSRKNASSKDLLSWNPKSVSTSVPPPPIKYGSDCAPFNSSLPFQNDVPMAGAPSLKKNSPVSSKLRSPTQKTSPAPFGTSETDFHGNLVRSPNKSSFSPASNGAKPLSETLSAKSSRVKSLSDYVS